MDIESGYKVRGYHCECLTWKLTTKIAQVSQIKEKVEEKEGIPPVQQRLIYGGKQMYEAHCEFH